MLEIQARDSSALRRGRQAGIVAFTLIVGAFTLAWTVQILQQVFFEAPAASAAARTDERTAPECLAEIGALRAAVIRARQVVLHSALPEMPALSAFQTELAPEWRDRVALDRLCTTREQHAALELLDEFRYAEEHAVRYEATRLHAVNEGLERYLNPEPY